jgi:LacI family transcriptional regulator
VALTDHGPSYDSVRPANRRGAADLTRALLGLGHRRFAVVPGPERLRVSLDRLLGVREALDEAGVALGPEAVEFAEFSHEGGRAATARLLERSRPTALIALSDVGAVGALAELRGRGLDVPGDISVVGFDDIPCAAQLAPALTTVRVPLERMGAEAVRLALEPRPRTAPGGIEDATDGLSAGPDTRSPRVVDLPTETVLRASTAPPPGAF